MPDEERIAPQRLTVSITLEPARGLRELDDRIENTINYFEVARVAQAIARLRPRRLIETLAEDIAAELLARFSVRAVEVELRKYILPDAAFVAVRFQREQPANP